MSGGAAGRGRGAAHSGRRLQPRTQQHVSRASRTHPLPRTRRAAARRRRRQRRLERGRRPAGPRAFRLRIHAGTRDVPAERGAGGNRLHALGNRHDREKTEPRQPSPPAHLRGPRAITRRDNVLLARLTPAGAGRAAWTREISILGTGQGRRSGVMGGVARPEGPKGPIGAGAGAARPLSEFGSPAAVLRPLSRALLAPPLPPLRRQPGGPYYGVRCCGLQLIAAGGVRNRQHGWTAAVTGRRGTNAPLLPPK